jgi:hypothetical protein
MRGATKLLMWSIQDKIPSSQQHLAAAGMFADYGRRISFFIFFRIGV